MFLSIDYYKEDQIMKVEMDEACSTVNRDKEYIIALARKRVGKRLGVSGKKILKRIVWDWVAGVYIGIYWVGIMCCSGRV